MILLLHLIRHAESQNNVRPAYSRVEDPPLTAAGMLQARYLAERFTQLEFDRLICSPFLRALQTARAIHDQLGCPVDVWDNIFEVGGVFQGHGPEALEGGTGLTRREVHQQAVSNPALCTADCSVKDSGWWGRPRETRDEAWMRAAKVKKRLAEIAVDEPDSVLVLVTHAAFTRNLLARLLDGTREKMRYARLCNTGVTSLYFDDGIWQIKFVDDVSHLPVRLVTGFEV